MTDRSRFSIIPIGSVHTGWALKIDGVLRRSSPSLISLGAYVDAIMAGADEADADNIARAIEARPWPTYESGWRSSRQPARGSRRATRSLPTPPRKLAELTFSALCASRLATWDPTWRAAINNGLRAIGTGDEATMERALHEINRLAETL